jgi:hypothetical protein
MPTKYPEEMKRKVVSLPIMAKIKQKARQAYRHEQFGNTSNVI